MIEDGIITYLLTVDDVTDLVGEAIDTLKSPQATVLPRLTLQRVSTARQKMLSGPVPLPNAMVQINCFAENAGDAKALAQIVRQAINDHTTTMGAYTVAGVWIEDERDLESDPGPADDGNDCGVSLDVSIWFSETP